jgi:hypothetical protein
MVARSRTDQFTLAALVLVLVAAWLVSGLSPWGDAQGVSDAPPPPKGWFRTLPAGAWSHLPGDAACASRLHRSLWEPRPDNAVPNHQVPAPGAVRAAFTKRPRDTAGGYDPRWDTWLLPRVNGNHTGTTDENIQWAACKWGIADNLLRAIAFRESGWFQNEVYPSGRCVPQHGCGDVAPASDAASRAYCRGIAAAGHDYQVDLGAGICPRTFSIVGVKAWQSPDWGRMPGNQNGTFPFSRDSTAFALDYLGGFLRGCQEGWVTWLDNLTRHYRPGHIWGCVGAWYSGDWRSAGALRYIRLVRWAMQHRPWLAPTWPEQHPPCSTDYGCPRGPTAAR